MRARRLSGGGDNRERAASAGRPQLTPAIAKDLDVALEGKVEDTGVPGATAAVVFADGREWRARPATRCCTRAGR